MLALFRVSVAVNLTNVHISLGPKQNEVFPDQINLGSHYRSHQPDLSLTGSFGISDRGLQRSA